MREAHGSGFRSRALAKLREIDAKDRLLRPGMSVVDLGAAPGGWSQYCAQRLGARGSVVALDALPMDAPAGVAAVQADFTEDEGLAALREALNASPVDLVLSDMAPNMSGHRSVDQPRAMYLAELALDFVIEVLRPGGDFVVKAFQGEGFDAYCATLRGYFRTVKTRKPQASRSRSREVYLLARDKLT